jgi:hypothetical protein
MNPAYISAIAALCGSAIGALAALGTTWLTQRHQDERRRQTQEIGRLERFFVDFIDLASEAFINALTETSMKDTSKFIPLYANMGKLRLFASDRTIAASEKVMSRLVETYYEPKVDFQTKPVVGPRSDILREFSEAARAELRGYDQ